MPKMTYAYGQVRNPSSGHIMMEMESNVMILSRKTIRVDRWVNKTSDFALETAVCFPFRRQSALFVFFKHDHSQSPNHNYLFLFATVTTKGPNSCNHDKEGPQILGP